MTEEGRLMKGETVKGTWARSGWGPEKVAVSIYHREGERQDSL